VSTTIDPVSIDLDQFGIQKTTIEERSFDDMPCKPSGKGFKLPTIARGMGFVDGIMLMLGGGRSQGVQLSNIIPLSLVNVLFV
jgi:hypothetical protein